MQDKPIGNLETEQLLSRITEEVPDALSIATRGTSCEPAKSMENDSLDMSFPWRREFRRKCLSGLIERSTITKLDELMAYYIGKVAEESKACCSKPKRAVKLKKVLNDAMLIFYFQHKDLNERMENSSYLDKMSQLLTCYMDVTIKTNSDSPKSLPTKPTPEKKKKAAPLSVVNKLMTILYMYLEGSTEYVLDTVLRSKFLTKSYGSFFIPILTKLSDDLATATAPSSKEPKTPNRKEPRNKIRMYMRYILMFKVWKKLVSGVAERRRINGLAEQHLTPPEHFRDAMKIGALCDILPKVPPNKNITEYYMVAKFDIKKKIEEFFNLTNSLIKYEFESELDKARFFSEYSPELDFGHNSNNLGEVGTSRLDDAISEFLADFKEPEEKPVKEKVAEKHKKDNTKGLNKNSSMRGASEVASLMAEFKSKLSEKRCVCDGKKMNVDPPTNHDTMDVEMAEPEQPGEEEKQTSTTHDPCTNDQVEKGSSELVNEIQTPDTPMELDNPTVKSTADSSSVITIVDRDEGISSNNNESPIISDARTACQNKTISDSAAIVSDMETSCQNQGSSGSNIVSALESACQDKSISDSAIVSTSESTCQNKSVCDSPLVSTAESFCQNKNISDSAIASIAESACQKKSIPISVSVSASESVCKNNTISDSTIASTAESACQIKSISDSAIDSASEPTCQNKTVSDSTIVSVAESAFQNKTIYDHAIKSSCQNKSISDSVTVSTSESSCQNMIISDSTIVSACQKRNTSDSAIVSVAETAYQNKSISDSAIISASEPTCQNNTISDSTNVSTTESASQNKPISDTDIVSAAESACQKNTISDSTIAPTGETASQNKNISDSAIVSASEPTCQNKAISDPVMVSTAEPACQNKKITDSIENDSTPAIATVTEPSSQNNSSAEISYVKPISRNNQISPSTTNITNSTELLSAENRQMEDISIKTESPTLVSDINENVTVKEEMVSPIPPTDEEPPSQKEYATLEEMVHHLFRIAENLNESTNNNVSEKDFRECFVKHMKLEKITFLSLPLQEKVQSQKPTEELFLLTRVKNPRQILRQPILKTSMMSDQLQSEDPVSAFTGRKPGSTFQEQVYFGMKAPSLLQNRLKWSNSWTGSPFLYTPAAKPIFGTETATSLSTYNSLVPPQQEKVVENSHLRFRERRRRSPSNVRNRGFIKLKKISELRNIEAEPSTSGNNKTENSSIASTENVPLLELKHGADNVIDRECRNFTDNVAGVECAEKPICSNLSSFLSKCVCDIKGCHGVTQVDNIPKSVETHQICDDMITKYNLLKGEVLQPSVNESHCLIPLTNDIIIMKDSYGIGAVGPEFQIADENVNVISKTVINSLQDSMVNNPPQSIQSTGQDVYEYCKKLNEPTEIVPPPALPTIDTAANDTQLSVSNGNEVSELVMDICSIAQEIEISSEPKFDELSHDSLSPSKILNQGVSAPVAVEQPESPMSDNSLKKVPSIKIKLVKNGDQCENSGEIVKTPSGDEQATSAGDEKAGDDDVSGCRSRKKKKHRHKERRRSRHRHRHHRCTAGGVCDSQRTFRPPSPLTTPPPSPPPPPPPPLPPQAPPALPPPPPPPPPATLPPSCLPPSYSLLPSESCTTPVTYEAYPPPLPPPPLPLPPPPHQWIADCEKVCAQYQNRLEMTGGSDSGIDELAEMGEMHDITTTHDVNVCTEQYKLIGSQQSVTLDTLIPCPLTNFNGRPRCNCLQCCNNFTILMANFNKILHFCRAQINARPAVHLNEHPPPPPPPFMWEPACPDDAKHQHHINDVKPEQDNKEPEIQYKLLDGIKFRKYDDDDDVSQPDNTINDSDLREELQTDIRNCKNYSSLPLKKRRKLTSNSENEANEVRERTHKPEWTQSTHGSDALEKERIELERQQKTHKLEKHLEEQKNLKLHLQKQLEIQHKHEREKLRQIEIERKHALIREKQRQREIDEQEALLKKKQQEEARKRKHAQEEEAMRRKKLAQGEAMRRKSHEEELLKQKLIHEEMERKRKLAMEEERIKRKKLAHEEFQKMKRRQEQQKHHEDLLRQKQMYEQVQKDHQLRRTTHQKVVIVNVENESARHRTEPLKTTSTSNRKNRKVESASASDTKAAETLMDFALNCSKLPQSSLSRIKRPIEDEAGDPTWNDGHVRKAAAVASSSAAVSTAQSSRCGNVSTRRPSSTAVSGSLPYNENAEPAISRTDISRYSQSRRAEEVELTRTRSETSRYAPQVQGQVQATRASSNHEHLENSNSRPTRKRSKKNSMIR